MIKILKLIKFINSTKIILIILSIFVVTLSSVINIYEKREQIKIFVDNKINKKDSYKQQNEDEDLYWSKKILNGGYILHFRHAERDKWIDVTMYDALESDVHNKGLDQSRLAENDYFKDAVCLNKRGIIQAKAMGESIKKIGMKVGKIYSSVSCRARQTSELVFGSEGSLHRILVHKGPYNEKKTERLDKLKKFYSEIDIIEGTNTIVSAHNSVIDCDMFINKKCPNHLTLEEGGFYVISQSDKGLVFEHEFHYFNSFNKTFYFR